MNFKFAGPVVAGIVLVGAGCISGRERVEREMNDLISKNMFDEARALEVKHNPGGLVLTDEEKAKNAMLPLVDRAEAKFIAARAKQLRVIVLDDLKKGDDTAARKHIYTFGITGQSRVDAALFLIKTGILNSRVNPASYARIGATAEKKCREAIARGDFNSAMEAYKTIKRVMAYPDAVDAGFDEASAEAVRQRCEKDGVEALILDAKRFIYAKTSPRDGYEKTDFVPDWSKVEQQLDVVRKALIDDDVPEKEAAALTDMVLSGIKAYFNDHATDEEMTTQELNDRLSSLRCDLYGAVQEAIKNAAAKAAAAKAAELREIAREFAAMVASEIDLDARVGAFIAAIGDRTEPDVNRILGDGARVLRLHLAGEEITPADATSLLAAASYMGFGDVASLAFALKADVNGASAKDSLGRTPFLLALQHGFRGGVREFLAKADRRKADAYGYNALHYAVRYGTSSDLLDAIDLGLDAKSAAKDGVTPLMIAADINNAAFAQALVAISDVNAADSKGYTALHYAIEAGSLPIVRMLIQAKANPMAQTKEGDSSLELAVMRPNENILNYLLDEVKVDGKNLKPTERAVDLCVIHSKVIPLTTLVAHGAKVADRHLAAAVLTDGRDGVLDMVKFLVERGCDVNSAEVKAAVLKCAVAPSPPMAADIIAYLKANGFRVEDGTPNLLGPRNEKGVVK